MRVEEGKLGWRTRETPARAKREPSPKGRTSNFVYFYSSAVSASHLKHQNKECLRHEVQTDHTSTQASKAPVLNKDTTIRLGTSNVENRERWEMKMIFY